MSIFEKGTLTQIQCTPKAEDKIVPKNDLILQGTLFPDLERKFFTADLRPERKAEVMAIARRLIANKSRYDEVSELTGVPWDEIGKVHSCESNMNFAGILHNGEQIIGTGRRTTIVPRGRGPFATWEEAAVDALNGGQWKPASWSLGERLEFEERYNGLGYRNRKLASPYLWSFTTLYTKGRYVADGKFDANSVSKQAGTCALMLALEELGAVSIQRTV